MQYKLAEIKGWVNNLENILENGSDNQVTEIVIEIDKLAGELKSCILTE